METEQKQYIECACGCCVMRISRERFEYEVDMTLYNRYQVGIIQRLRQAWQMLRHGQLTDDVMALLPGEVHDFSVALKNMYNSICADLEMESELKSK